MRKLWFVLLLAGCGSAANHPVPTPPTTPPTTAPPTVAYATCIDPFGFEYRTDPIVAKHICRETK